MAKLLQPLMSAAARGKVNGTIYNSWRGVAYAKNFASPTQPRTIAQLKFRSFMVDGSRAWQALTQAQRDGWIAYATAHPVLDWTGKSIRLTGANVYVSCYVLAKFCGLTPKATAPAENAPAGVGGLTTTPGTGQVVVGITTPTATYFYWDVRGYQAGSTGQAPRFNQARSLSIKACAASNLATIVGLNTGFKAHFWVRTISSTTFLPSVWQQSSTTVG